MSLRTIYRDIATLIAQGAPIEGAAGLGYVLLPGFFLPPLMFSEDELDALILGLRLAAGHGDEVLGNAARQALAKIAAVLPREMEDAAATSGLLAGRLARSAAAHLPALRQAMRTEEKVKLTYADRQGAVTERTVWPVAIGFFAAAQVLAAWCETRAGFRHFRLDRIVTAELSGVRYPKRRRVLLADWWHLQGIES